MNGSIQHEDAAYLLTTVKEISHAPDMENLTQVVKRAARTLSGADGITFVLRDNDQCYYIDEDAISPLWKGKRFPMESCISGWAMLNRETVIIEDIYADDRIPREVYQPTFVKSLLMIPVRSADPIAAIGAYWASRHRATARETELLQWLADTTAVAIDNVQLIASLKQRAEESERLLEQVRHEVSRREAAEEQFQQAQKMEAVGRLAGGVAHDFNNLLSVICGYADLVLQDMPESDDNHEPIAEIKGAGERASRLTRQLLAFSRKQKLQFEILNLNEVVANMTNMVRRLLGEDIDLVVDLDDDLYPVRFDPGQIEQIIMNLAVNARDAMPDGGKLTIETANAMLDEAYAGENEHTEPGPHVVIAVTDTGEGMDAETRAQIFEPFYTTKMPDQGTGLGLSTVFGIVRQSHGHIWVYSEPGHGTTFKVYLPRAEQMTSGGKAEPELVDDAGAVTATILVVEDEDGVRRLVRRCLEAEGYTVLDTSDVDEALEICRWQEGDVDLLLTDIVLPGSGGPELAERALAIRPGLKVAYMSGYTERSIVHRGTLSEDAPFIDKPITPQVLARKVREALQGRGDH